MDIGYNVQNDKAAKNFLISQMAEAAEAKISGRRGPMVFTTLEGHGLKSMGLRGKTF